MVSTSSQMPMDVTNQKQAKYSVIPGLLPPSKGQEQSSSTETSSPTSQSGGGSTQMSDISQPASQKLTLTESNSHHSEQQGALLNGPTAQPQTRRGTDQSEPSEPYTPSPVDPAQVDSSQRLGWAGMPRISLFDNPGKDDRSRESAEGSRLDGDHSREYPFL